MRRRQPHPYQHLVDVVCVLVVLAATVALVAWIVANAGGGVLNQG